MSNYTKATNFAAKDSLPSGNAGKIIKGTEIDTEFNAIASAISSKADTNSPTFTGTPLAPTQATASTSNTQIATTAFVQAAIAAANLVPSGTIVLWSGSVASIPTGWVLCNGSNGTPDLRNRFVVGAGSTYAVAATGGSADAIVVSHNHTATSSVTDPGHNHVYRGGEFTPNKFTSGAQSNDGVNNGGGDAYVSTATTGVTVGTTVASTGSSGTNANLPPYYALAYIMKS
jgi:hypothetical protein